MMSACTLHDFQDNFNTIQHYNCLDEVQYAKTSYAFKLCDWLKFFKY